MPARSVTESSTMSPRAKADRSPAGGEGDADDTLRSRSAARGHREPVAVETSLSPKRRAAHGSHLVSILRHDGAVTDPVAVDEESAQAVRPAGRFRLYIGAAAGVGKTVAILDEGWRRHTRAAAAVIGFVETHGRPKTTEEIGVARKWRWSTSEAVLMLGAGERREERAP